MIQEYIQTALNKAKYEIIDNKDENFFAEIPELNGVWATGSTFEDCRKNLIDVIEGWIIIRLKNHLNIPELDGINIENPREIAI